LVVYGFDYAFVGLERTGGGMRLVCAFNKAANKPGAQETEVENLKAKSRPIYLRVSVTSDAVCQFSYSYDNQVFMGIGGPFQSSGDRWIGAKVGVISSAPPGTKETGHADFDWFRMTPRAR
jgi:Beta xylosidase C-terminal Concanavalin A-like domain